MSVVKALKELGAMVQINFYSIVNEQKAQTRETANAFLAEKLVDFIGSDAHRTDHRPPVIRDGIEALEERYDNQFFHNILLLKKLLDTTSCRNNDMLLYTYLHPVTRDGDHQSNLMPVIEDTIVISHQVRSLFFFICSLLNFICSLLNQHHI